MNNLGHSRTIIGIEQRASGLTLLVLDPSHGPRQVAALGSSRDSLRLIRRNMAAMRAPQYQIVAVKGLFETEEQYQVISKFIFRNFSSFSLSKFILFVRSFFFLRNRRVKYCVHYEFLQIDGYCLW